MSNFVENSIKVGGSTSDSILPGRGKINIKLTLKDKIEGLVLTLTNVFYLFNNSSNLVSLGLLNNARIYYYSKD